MPRPYLYLILSLHRHMATTSDPMRWRGSSAEHVCWRRSAVRWARGHTGPFRRTPATTPSPSEPSPSLYLRPLGRYSSGARGATAVRAGALEPPANELIVAHLLGGRGSASRKSLLLCLPLITCRFYEKVRIANANRFRISAASAAPPNPISR